MEQEKIETFFHHILLNNFFLLPAFEKRRNLNFF